MLMGIGLVEILIILVVLSTIATAIWLLKKLTAK